jgi:hypothetical protein
MELLVLYRSPIAGPEGYDRDHMAAEMQAYVCVKEKTCREVVTWKI